MLVLLAQWVVNAIAILIVSRLVPGIVVADFVAALIAAVVIGLINTIIKPVLLLLTLPINILTLGLFTFFVNAILLLIASSVSPGFHVEGFWAAFWGSIVLTIISGLLHALTRSK